MSRSAPEGAWRSCPRTPCWSPAAQFPGGGGPMANSAPSSRRVQQRTVPSGGLRLKPGRPIHAPRYVPQVCHREENLDGIEPDTVVTSIPKIGMGASGAGATSPHGMNKTCSNISRDRHHHSLAYGYCPVCLGSGKSVCSNAVTLGGPIPRRLRLRSSPLRVARGERPVPVERTAYSVLGSPFPEKSSVRQPH